MKSNNYVDNLYYVLFCSVAIITGTIAVWLVFMGFNFWLSYLSIIYFVLIIFLSYFFFARSYIFEDDSLFIKVGLFTKKYNYRDMKKCYITNNHKLSFATSHKRICIKLKDETIYISPEKMDEALFKLINKTGGTK